MADKEELIRAVAHLFVADVRKRLAGGRRPLSPEARAFCDDIRQRIEIRQARRERNGPAVAEIARKAGATLR
jgi:hypothetical protein